MKIGSGLIWMVTSDLAVFCQGRLDLVESKWFPQRLFQGVLREGHLECPLPPFLSREEQSLLGGDSHVPFSKLAGSERKQPGPGRSPLSVVAEKVVLSRMELAAGFLQC